MKDMTIAEAVIKLFVKYGEYGASMEILDGAVKEGIGMGLSVRGAYNILRMEFAREFGEHEKFTVEDVMSITDETREEVLKRIEEEKENLIREGKNPDDYFISADGIWGNLKFSMDI